MKERKLSYRFFNPNTEEDTADFLLKLFAEVNEPKAEEAIRRAAGDRTDPVQKPDKLSEGTTICAW